MGDNVLFKTVVPTVVGVLALLLIVIAVEKNTNVDFGFIGDLARVVWFVVIAALAVGFIVALIRFLQD